MTSSINTNGLNVNYPVPGTNNNSQGFRDNFATIKTNLDTASSEITDLENKAVLKQALANSTLNNDMANTLISNALVRGFRATSYNLGNALSGTLTIDVSQADVQYGNIAGNTTLQFSNWGPTNTQSNLQLVLNVGNSEAVISFPNNVSNGNAVSSLENYANISGIATVTTPHNVKQLDYRLSTLDCGNTVIIEPFNRPRISSQVQYRTPAPTGFQGDVAGTVAVDSNYIYICDANYNSTTVSTTATQTTAGDEVILSGNVSSLVVNAPIIFNNNIGGIVANTVYYIKSKIPGNSAITISSTGFYGVAGDTLDLVAYNPNVSVPATSYNGTYIWSRLPSSVVSIVSNQSAITANGSSQSTAYQLTTSMNIISNVTSGQGVVLPAAVPGMILYVSNDSANTLIVYPNTGDSVNSNGVNNGYSLPSGGTIQFMAATASRWLTVGSTYA